MIILEKNGIKRSVPSGFSWTTLFFDFFVPLFRGDLVWFFVMLLLLLLTSGISGFIFPFFYNRIYIKKQLDNGWKPVTKQDKDYVQGIY